MALRTTRTARAWAAGSRARGARTAHPAKRTLRVFLRTVEAAGIHHAQMAQGKVVADRIARVERAKRRGDLRSHLPPGAYVFGQAQAASDADYVCIEGDDQPRG